MNILRAWWQKVCVPLDGFLWRKDISHPIIRPVIRNEILAGGACLLAGAGAYAVFPWLFWFGAGLGCMVWIFWSWAKFFLRFSQLRFDAPIMRAIVFHFGLRLLVLAALLYLVMAFCNASPVAILAGLVTGGILALISFALNMTA